jgi:aminoacrylate hydrolase
LPADCQSRTIGRVALLKLADCDVFYELAGNGPPVLFIQGVGVAGEGWRPQVDGLAGSFSTLRFDNRGLGKSVSCRGRISIEAMAADARDLLDAAGWESAHVVGHSMGGVIAQQLALDVPARVRSLSLLCTFPRGKDAARLTPWVLWMTLRTRVGSRRMRRQAFLEMLFPKEELQRADLDLLATQVGALIGRDLADSPSILMKQVQALARHDVSARLGELAAIPTLVVNAEHDPIAPPRYGRRLAELIPGARYEEVPAASHGVTIQKADLINGRLGKFLADVDSSVGRGF